MIKRLLQGMVVGIANIIPGVPRRERRHDDGRHGTL